MKKESVQDYCNKELDQLKKVGDKCVLIGRITTLRSCVSRYQEDSTLVLNTKVIGNDVHVIVMGVGDE